MDGAGASCVAVQEQWPLEEKGSRTFGMEQGQDGPRCLKPGLGVAVPPADGGSQPRPAPCG